MQRFLYSSILYLATPLILIRLLLRSIKSPNYRRRWGERFGRFTPPERFDANADTLWVHAVSVGETLAAVPLIQQLRRQYPATQLLITTMTPTGSDRVRDLFGDSVIHSYIPYDMPTALNRFIKKLNPRLLILMETELWPNTINCCHKNGVKVLLANGRLSQRSAKGYARFSTLSREMLNQIDVIAAQAQADADRFRSLGAKTTSVKVTGSLKFNVDIEPREGDPKPGLKAVIESIKGSGRTVLIAASTREGEEDKVLSAFRSCLEKYPDLLLLLVPRHPERFQKIAKLCEEKGFSLARRSQSVGQQSDIDTSAQVFLGDSMGEMLDYYRLANIAFVGGSLVDTGCHNVLEPAAMGLPTLVGPSQFNFATICSQLEKAGALKTIQSEAELATFVMSLLKDQAKLQHMGEQGKTLVAANQNALPEIMKLVESLAGS